MTKQKEENIITEEGKLVQNEPNARILISALQHIGYDDVSAIADIIDNSIDANATKIKIYIEKDKNGKIEIKIIDNGNGMNKETLDEALKLGSNTIHDDISDLGKFGMGLSTAGLALANQTIVFTKTCDSKTILKSITDVDVIRKMNQFVKILEETNEDEKEYFNRMVQSDSGTIIILKNCEGIKLNTESTLKQKIIKNIARVFRNFMSKIEFYVNDVKIEADDPLRLKVKEGELKGNLFSEDDYLVRWKNVNGEEKKGIIHIKLVSLPECDINIARKLGINMSNQGFSVLRNNREIAIGFLPKWEGLARDPHLNRFRGEISFSSDMDDAMGVNFRKNGIDMIDSVDNILRGLISPQIKTIKKNIRKKIDVSEEEKQNHKNNEKMLNKMSNILTLPKGISAISEFKLLNMGETGDIYKAEQIGRKLVISWNIDHPFYQKLIVENIENPNVIKIADFFIYTLAFAQIQFMADDEEKNLIMSSIISTMSTNMRNLLF